MKKRLIGLVLTIFMLIVSSQIGIKPASARVPVVPTSTVTFSSSEGKFKDGGTLIDIEVDKGESVPANEIPEVTPPEGSIFKGWKNSATSDKLLSKEEIAKMVISHPTEFDAVFESKNSAIHTVTLSPSDSGEFSNNEDQIVLNVKHGSTINDTNGLEVEEPEPVNDDEEFSHWYETSTARIYTTEEIKKLTINKDEAFTATFKKKQLKNLDITFDAGEGSFANQSEKTKKITVQENSNIKLSDIPTPVAPDGKVFLYWTIEGDGAIVTSENITKIPVAINSTYKAEYANKSYTLKFDAGEGYFGNDKNDKIYTVEVNHGYIPNGVTTPNAPEGYTFSKWVSIDGSDKGSTDEISKKRVFKNIEYKAEYTKNPSVPNVPQPGAPEKINLEIQIEWNDANNQDGLRPNQLEVTLFKNGVATSTKVIATKPVGNPDSNTWVATFNDLDKKDTNGDLIEYTVRPDNVADHSANYNKANKTLTISHTPKTVDIKVVINWEDTKADNPKKEVRLELHNHLGIVNYGNAERKGNQSIYTFKNQPLNDKGQKIAYEVKQDNLADYKTIITKGTDGNFTITNVYNKINQPVVPIVPVPNNPKPENKVIKIDKKQPAAKKQLPHTGNLNDVSMYGSAILLSGLGLILISKKKKVKA